MIRGYLSRARAWARASLGRRSFSRRLVTRAVVVLGAVLVGGQVMRTLPRDQTLIFPVGSEFPNASRFAASWREAGDRDSEPRGGVSLTFTSAPPLQIREHAKLPDGDYIVTIDIAERGAVTNAASAAAKTPQSESPLEGLQTNIERRVSLSGGETLIALAHREPSVSE